MSLEVDPMPPCNPLSWQEPGKRRAAGAFVLQVVAQGAAHLSMSADVGKGQQQSKGVGAQPADPCRRLSKAGLAYRTCSRPTECELKDVLSGFLPAILFLQDSVKS